jgi:hypothetical protein
MDGVHTLRNDTCADAVVLLVGDSASCGIAYVMTTIFPGFESHAFSVVSTNCATGYYSFGHELGHNMGARHDWYVDGSDTYAHGFVNATDRWRTIMAYNADCADRGFDCSRLQYWSNPFVLYNSDPMGVENGTSRPCITAVHDPDCDADNHLMLNSSALTVANFRDSGVCGIPTYNIKGYVRDSTGEGIEGVNVDFEGIRPAVVTNEAGYYTQLGFVDGNYAVHFTSQGHMFLPADPLVTVAGSDAVQDATGYPAAVLPFRDGFESGILGKSWIEAADNEGRVRIESLYPYLGNYSLLLDDSIAEGDYSHASGSLFVDLSDHKDVRLSFWWREFDDEDHPNDGVFISDDYGATWSQAFSFNGSTEVFTHTIIDLDSTASAAGMTLNNHFLVKFQFFGNFPIPFDGYAIDDVQINTLVGPLKYQTHTVNDDDLGDSRGDDDSITECGETIELFVTLTNQGSITATLVTATLSTLDPYATFLFNNASSYPDIPSGGSGDNVNDYDLMISSQAPDGHSIPFVLDITASNGGRWTDSFDLTVGCKVHIPLVIR